MSRRKGEPVKNTCPDINHLIDEMSTVFKDLESISHDDYIGDILDVISNVKQIVKNIAIGNNSDLENLRSSNAEIS